MGNNLRALAGEFGFLNRPEKIILSLDGLTVGLEVTGEARTCAFFPFGGTGPLDGIMGAAHGLPLALTSYALHQHSKGDLLVLMDEFKLKSNENSSAYLMPRKVYLFNAWSSGP